MRIKTLCKVYFYCVEDDAGVLAMQSALFYNGQKMLTDE